MNYIYVVNDADECQRGCEDVYMRNLASQDDGLRTGNVKMKGVNHSSGSSRDLSVSQNKVFSQPVFKNQMIIF